MFSSFRIFRGPASLGILEGASFLRGYIAVFLTLRRISDVLAINHPTLHSRFLIPKAWGMSKKVGWWRILGRPGAILMMIGVEPPILKKKGFTFDLMPVLVCAFRHCLFA